MADTPRTLAALQAILADAGAVDISAQDVRDFLVSAALVTGTGEIGGTADVPTVAASHSGSTHSAATATHEAAADPHTGYRLESADHTHASSGLQAGVLYSITDYANVPDAAPGATITAGDAQGAIYHSGPSAETAIKLFVDAETAPGASGLPVTWQFADTDDLDTAASWTTIATLTLSSEKSSSTTSMTNATITANRLMRTNWGTIVGTPKDATTVQRVKRPLST